MANSEPQCLSTDPDDFTQSCAATLLIDGNLFPQVGMVLLQSKEKHLGAAGVNSNELIKAMARAQEKAGYLQQRF